jgi:hypothetical protein
MATAKRGKLPNAESSDYEKQAASPMELASTMIPKRLDRAETKRLAHAINAAGGDSESATDVWFGSLKGRGYVVLIKQSDGTGIELARPPKRKVRSGGTNR